MNISTLWEKCFNILFVPQNRNLFWNISLNLHYLFHWVSDCCLTPKWVIYPLYLGENKLHFNEMMSVLYYTNRLSCIFIVRKHWNNSPWVDMHDKFELSFHNGGALVIVIVWYWIYNYQCTDCTGICKSNYHTITTATASTFIRWNLNYTWISTGSSYTNIFCCW